MKKFNRFYEWIEYLELQDIKVEIRYSQSARAYTAYDISHKMGEVVGRFYFDTNYGWVQL